MRRWTVVATLSFVLTGTGSAACRDSAGPTVTPAPKPAVVVRMDRTSYPAGALPVVLIRNGLRQAITATTGRTDCTTVWFDRLQGRVWKEVRNCFSGEPPRPVRIAAGTTLRVRLIEVLPPGTYRARFEYSVRGVPARALSAQVRMA